MDRISSGENGEMEKNNGENEKVEKKSGEMEKIGQNWQFPSGKKWRKFAIKVDKNLYTMHF